MSTTTSLPQSLGRYEVVGFLAAGGMAEILLGRLVGPSGFERPVVIKRMHSHLVRDARFASVLSDEARLVARIRHPNVIQVFELGRDSDELFLVMEYLEGESLGGVMRRTFTQRFDFPHGLAAYIVAETAAGLHAAHELRGPDGRLEGLVHRDVTPQNVFVAYDGGVKLLDFGIAKAVDRSTRTETGTLKGKYHYMSPEQCQGQPLDRRSDVFALGIVLYELTSGCRLFKRPSDLLTFQAICRERIRPPSAFRSDYPADLEAVVMRALQKDPRARYQDAASMRRDLLAVIHRAGEREPREHLASLMQSLFRDRAEQKQEMLRRVQSGAEVGSLPSAETDESVDLPALTQAGTQLSVASASGLREHRPRSRGRALISIAAVVLIASAAILAMRHRKQIAAQSPPQPTEAARLLPSPAASTTPLPAARALPNPALQHVQIAIESSPPGAEVTIDGTSHGGTPVTVALERDETPVTLELRLRGYETLKRSITPNLDQRLMLSLKKRKGTRRVVHRASTRPKAHKAEGFTRFE